MKNTSLSLSLIAVVLTFSSCDTLCTSGNLVVSNHTNETIYVYSDNTALGSVAANDQNTFDVDSGEQVIEVESGLVAPTLEVYNVDVSGCGETALDVN